MLVDGEPISGSIFDFGLYFFHNARELLSRGSETPTSTFQKSRATLRRVSGTISSSARKNPGNSRAAPFAPRCSSETILASFEMDENSSRASRTLRRPQLRPLGLHLQLHQRKFSTDPHAILPDRAQVTMATHFMRSYSKLAIKLLAFTPWAACRPTFPSNPVPWPTIKPLRSTGRQRARSRRRPRRHMGRASRPRSRCA